MIFVQFNITHLTKDEKSEQILTTNETHAAHDIALSHHLNPHQIKNQSAGCRLAIQPNQNSPQWQRMKKKAFKLSDDFENMK